MGKREDILRVKNVMDSINTDDIMRMDNDTFVAFVCSLIDVHARVTVLHPTMAELQKEVSKDYVDDFFIAIFEFMKCRENFAERLLKERIEVLDNGRS